MLRTLEKKILCGMGLHVPPKPATTENTTFDGYTIYAPCERCGTLLFLDIHNKWQASNTFKEPL